MMSEHLSHSPEHFKPVESATEQHHGPHSAEQTHVKHGHQEALQNIKLEVEQQALSTEDVTVEPVESRSKDQPLFINKELKSKALKDTLRQVRRHLSTPERQLSKAIHLKSVEKVSEVGAKTIARPSGLLGAGAFALVGSFSLLLISNHYGYEYKFSALLYLLIVGFIVGIVADLLLGLAHKTRSKSK